MTEVFFKLPHSKHYTHLVQNDAPRTFAALTDVPPSGGYVVVPFAAERSCPIILIEPDTTERLSLPETAETSAPSILLTDEETQRADYHRAFSETKQMLADGTLSKMVLSRRLGCKGIRNTNAREMFFSACNSRPASYVAMWRTDNSEQWLVASPEPLLCRENGLWHTVALAGTLPLAEGEVPIWNAKNREEQAIVARYVENCLKSCTQNLQVSETHTLPSGNIQHLCTDFHFALPSGVSPLSVAARLHPTPAVCGLPCREALQSILHVERSPRRYYAGFSGPLNLDGDTQLYVSLRCMSFAGSAATLYAGGGIMPNSTEQDEWDETARKMLAMRQLL